jgi:hypothetical protein
MIGCSICCACQWYPKLDRGRKSAYINIIFENFRGCCCVEISGVYCGERENTSMSNLRTHSSLSAAPTARAEACGEGRRHLSPYAGIANRNAIPAHPRHPGAHHGKRRDSDTSGRAGVLLLSDRGEDQALLRALLVAMRCDWPTLGVVRILLDDGLRLWGSMA